MQPLCRLLRKAIHHIRRWKLYLVFIMLNLGLSLIFVGIHNPIVLSLPWILVRMGQMNGPSSRFSAVIQSRGSNQTQGYEYHLIICFLSQGK